MTLERSSGVILHPTSLPSPDGIGDLGPEAYRWVDFLAESGSTLWQVLPLGTNRLWRFSLSMLLRFCRKSLFDQFHHIIGSRTLAPIRSC